MKIGDRAAGSDRPAGTIVASSLVMVWTLLVFAAIVLWWRRLEGALVNPLEPSLLLGAAVIVAAAAAAVRLVLHGQAAWLPRELAGFLLDSAGSHARATRWGHCLPWTVSATVVAIGSALSLRDTSLVGLVLFWTILVGEELWGWTRRRPLRLRGAAPAAVSPIPEPPAPVSLPQPSEPPVAILEEPELDAAAPSDVLQQVIRRRTADGGELVSGWLRVPLAANQRTANVHVAFCPPFPRTPQVAVDQLDGPAARIKKVQVLPYGARLDLKLAEHSDAPASVVLQFSAQSGPPIAPVAGAERPEDASRELE